ncbi:MAG: hypothetical protein JSS66_13325 [Armatimonadetes bacterium]|nr:hypothetical protein [Armatimonadota bacterium]
MLIGDVLAVLSLVVTTGIALLCAMVLSALLFPERTTRAARQIESHPWKCVMSGLVVMVPVLLLCLALFQVPNPLARTAAVIVSLVVVLVAAAGSGGLARLVGQRIKRGHIDDQSLPEVAMGSALVIGTSLLPLAGWFLLAPLMLVCSFGAGVRTMRRPSQVKQVLTEAQ